jgi:hypothetical protein
LNERHPFNVEICRILPGKTPTLTIPIARSGSSTTLSQAAAWSVTRRGPRQSR